MTAAYGRADDGPGAPRSGDLSREQEVLPGDQAIAGLSQDRRIVPVRLALFAEMVKGRPWTPATLREVGGMEGVGVKFLEDTLSSPRSNPNHRYHQRAAQAVLKALLPETNADIKGRMRSIEELREASGYAGRPADFADLVRILDNDLRLITPVDPEGSVGDEEFPGHGPGWPRYFQLTHDYLVHALREWLTRKQRETRRGRAELLLAERAALWAARPEDRYLPSVREWAGIRLLTEAREDWSEPLEADDAARRAAQVIALAASARVAIVVAGHRPQVVGPLVPDRRVESGIAFQGTGRSLLTAETPRRCVLRNHPGDPGLRDGGPKPWPAGRRASRRRTLRRNSTPRLAVLIDRRRSGRPPLSAAPGGRRRPRSEVIKGELSLTTAIP